MNTQASSAIENGLTAQLMNKVTPIPRQCCPTSCSAPKSTRSSIGTIITQMSKPTGRLTLANSSRPTAWTGPGRAWPSAMPATMHRNTQRERKRSKKLMVGLARRWGALDWLRVGNSTGLDGLEQFTQLGIGQGLEVVRQQLQHSVADCLAGQFERGRALAFRGSGRVWIAPVGLHRAARPVRAGFVGGVVAHRDDETHAWRLGDGESVPAFAAERRGVDAETGQRFKGVGIHPAARGA